MVEKTKDPKGIWVFRTREEKWHKDGIHGATKGAGIRLIVWACIWDRNKGTLIPILEKRGNRYVYIGVLKDGLGDVCQEVEDTVEDPILQQDSAKIRTARDTMAWLAENSLQVMEWPPNSPDLNSIEHCWKRVKEKLHQCFPNSHKTKGAPDNLRKHLAETQNQVWAPDIEGEFLERLWESLPTRVAAVIEARG